MGRLLPLREELEIFARDPDARGEESWVIFDPVRNQYFRISMESLIILRYWNEGSPKEILTRIQLKEGITVKPEELEQLEAFLRDHQLLRIESEQNLQGLIQSHSLKKKQVMQQLLHSYLFIRIPLIKPDRWLESVLGYVRPLFSRKWFYLLLLMAVSGIYLTLRQWDLFTQTAAQSFSPVGVVYFISALLFTKTLHELGHGLAAKYYGCPVPSMGVAFLVMFPVLYTDTTGAWRLSSYKQRMVIGSAGLLAELILAVVATFLWSFFPEGPFRSALVMLAAVTWVSSVLINLNPFMRFDGYYLLSDGWRIDNLQQRAFALARWQLREWLFGLNRPMPEPWSPSQKRKLLLYAYGTWIYRFFLFMAIAILVYQFFFKVLGIILFVVEIVWFIIRPVFHEVRYWWQQRQQIQWNRNNVILAGIASLILILLFIPTRTTLSLPAVLTSAERTLIFPPQSGGYIQEVMVSAGELVDEGQPLFQLSNPDLNQKRHMLRLQLSLINTLLDRKAANQEYLRETPILLKRKASLIQELAGVDQQITQLVVRAPFSGIVVDMDSWLSKQQWLYPKRPVLQLMNSETMMVESYLPAKMRHRMDNSNEGWFIPDDLTVSPIKIELSSIGRISSHIMKADYLSSDYGGDIEISRDSNDRAITLEGMHDMTFVVPKSSRIERFRILTGEVSIEVVAQSLVERLWNSILVVLIRESG